MLFRYSKTFDNLLNFIPDKEDNVALTFHNISSNQLDWFKETIDYLFNKYEFINPANLENEIQNKRNKILMMVFHHVIQYSSMYCDQEI